MLNLIAAIDGQRGVADDHGIPWQGRIPGDTAYFREQTSSGVVLMGFRTYLEFDRPLHARTNFVVTRADSEALRPGFAAVVDLDEFATERLDQTVWVIGGAGLFAQTIHAADELYLTQLDQDFGCTKFFPEFNDLFLLASASELHSENDVSYRFEVWRRHDDRTGGSSS
ncbi:MAG: dihydrofolate reductase [Acidimicrobiales bacterium]